MKNIFKKNQLMITALAIMIAIAGYLQFAENTMEGEKEEASQVGSGNVISENYTAGSIRETAGTGASLEGILDLSEEDLLLLSGNEKTLDIQSLDSDVDVVLEDYLEEGMEVSQAGEGQESVSATPQEGEIPGEAVFTSGSVMEVLTDAKLLKEQTRAKNKEILMGIVDSENLSDAQKQQAVTNMVEMTQIAEKEAAAEILLEAKGFSDVVVSISGSNADVVVNALTLSDAQRAQIEDIIKRKTGISPENLIISTVVAD